MAAESLQLDDDPVDTDAADWWDQSAAAATTTVKTKPPTPTPTTEPSAPLVDRVRRI
jgi:hypothetical protein